MAASTTDKLDRVTDSTTGRPVLTQLATPGKAIGASSITCNDLTNWTTSSKIHFSIYNTTSAGVKDPTTQTDWTGIVSGNTITSLVLTGGTDRTYNPGAIVDATPTAAWAKDLYDNVTGHANQDGSLKTAAVQTALNLGNTPSAGWTPLGTTFTYTGNNGNKEFTLTAPIDLTTTLSKGMKIQFTRSTTPPTQCMAFAAASSQYATKVTPAGITFTAAFTAETWLYLLSYPTGASGQLINRMDQAGTTGGWRMYINTSGQITVDYGTGSTFTTFLSAQSVPLTRWLHIAGVVTSTASKTGAIYLNGASLPVTNPNVAATSLVQAAVDLRIGAASATPASTYLNGYMAETRLWSVGQTQAAIQANMGISLTGSETNLVGLWQGNGNFNDKTTNANNLTATGGAVATQNFSTINGGTANEPTPAPMNAVEYGIITDVSIFTGGVTTIKVFTGVAYCIPNGGLTGPQYSVARAPFGFPAAKGLWTVNSVVKVQVTQPSAATGTWYNVGNQQLSVPSGEWRLMYEASPLVNGTTTAELMTGLSTANNTQGDPEFTSQTFIASTALLGGAKHKERPVALATQTIYYLNHAQTNGSGVTIYNLDASLNGVPAIIEAESAYI